MTQDQTCQDLATRCHAIAQRAREASLALGRLPAALRSQAVRETAAIIDKKRSVIAAANGLDLDAGRQAGLSQAMLDRLALNDARLGSIIASLQEIADQPDPVGQCIEGRVLPNGLNLARVRCPLGVVLMIFESRPNVTTDAAGLCLKSGNAVILRGGKEAMHSNKALADCVREALVSVGLPEDAVQLLDTTDRQAVTELLKLDTLIDVCIPRGGESLIRAVVEQAHLPVIKHYTGNCHVYIDCACDADMAVDIVLNAKTQRPGVCNAMETLLVHRDHVASGLLERLLDALTQAGVALRGDESVCEVASQATPATSQDWHEEYLDLILAVRVVDSLEQAIDHINRYGSRHTDAIVTTQIDAAERFIQDVDTANAFINCSTRFSDGGQYGLGAEIGISTDKLHARGPMGAADLTTYKWVIRGQGQVRS